jgi:Cdc6-like AAA superfamily ATPase
MEKKFSVNYPLYDTVYGNEIPTEQYYVILFDKLPSKFSNSKILYNPLVITELMKMGFVEELRILTNNRSYDSFSQSMFVHKDKKIIVKTNTSVDKLTIGNLNLDFAYSIENGEIGNQLDLDSLKKFQTKKKKASIQLVKSEMGHLDTEDYDLMVPPIDLELNYGKDFKKIHKVIIDRLNKTNDKGIILLHGDPGTGKTSYIKYLTSLIKDKDILFIPPSMAEMLSEPTIIPFLMDHKNSILIIEDAERVISDREGNGSPAGVSNILNLTDGILGDCLNIQVIATFNMKREKIDQALLRKGRLIAEHKFERLSVDDTNKLLKSLKKNHTVEEGMVLADIYNIDTEVYKTSSKGNKIGF